MAQVVKNLPAMQETQVWSLGQEDPLEREWQPTPVFLPGKSHASRSLAGYIQSMQLQGVRTERLTFSLQFIIQYDTLQGLTWAGGPPENTSLPLFLGITRSQESYKRYPSSSCISLPPHIGNRSVNQTIGVCTRAGTHWPFLATLHLLESDYKGPYF